MAIQNIFQSFASHKPSLGYLHFNATPIAFSSPTFCEQVDEFVSEAADTLNRFSSQIDFMLAGYFNGSYPSFRVDACDYLQEVKETISTIGYKLGFLRVIARNVTASVTPDIRAEAIESMLMFERSVEKDIFTCNSHLADLDEKLIY